MRGTNGSLLLSNLTAFTGSYNFAFGATYASVIGGAGTNVLSVQANSAGDTIDLNQNQNGHPLYNGPINYNEDGTAVGYGGPINITGWNPGQISEPALIAVAVGISNVSVLGGGGNDTLDAGGMIVPVTLNGGSGHDALEGGEGNTTFIYNSNTIAYSGAVAADTYFDNSIYSLGTGVGALGNTLTYDDTNGDSIAAYDQEFYDATTSVSYNLDGYSKNIDQLEVDQVRSGLTLTGGSTTLSSAKLLTGLAVGQSVVGPGVPVGTTISKIAGNTLTLSQPISSTGMTLTFPGAPDSTGSGGLSVTSISVQASEPAGYGDSLDPASLSAVFTYYSPPSTGSETALLAATVNWGDGTMSPANVIYEGSSGYTGTYDVFDEEHVYNTGKVQTVATSATGGNFTLSFNGATTGAIPFNASATTVQAALAALATIGGNNVAVSEIAGGPWTVTFQNALGDGYMPAMTANGANLSGAGASVSVASVSTYTVTLTIANEAYQSIYGAHGLCDSEREFHGWLAAGQRRSARLCRIGIQRPGFCAGFLRAQCRRDE